MFHKYNNLLVRKLKEAELRREVESLQTEMLRLLTSRRPGYKAESAFGTFASRELAKTLGNKVTNNLLNEATLSSAKYNKFIHFYELCAQLKPIKDNFYHMSHVALSRNLNWGLNQLEECLCSQNSENFCIHPVSNG